MFHIGGPRGYMKSNVVVPKVAGMLKHPGARSLVDRAYGR